MAGNKNIKSIDEEMVCADSLAHCLKRQCGCHDVIVKKEKNDPPDFWFTIEGERYAAEVTSIVTGQAYRAACKKLEDAIRNSAEEEGTINGTYVLLIMCRPRIPRCASSDWCALLWQATSFIHATGSVESTAETRLLEDSDGHLDIIKISGNGALLATIGPTESKWEGEIHDELRELIKDRIIEKRHKLEKKGIPEICPRMVLLLYDAYGFGHVEDAEKALASISGYDWFHSVFWATSFTDRENELLPANPGRIGRFIYSANERWWKSSTTRYT